MALNPKKGGWVPIFEKTPGINLQKNPQLINYSTSEKNKTSSVSFRMNPVDSSLT